MIVNVNAHWEGCKRRQAIVNSSWHHGANNMNYDWWKLYNLCVFYPMARSELSFDPDFQVLANKSTFYYFFKLLFILK